MTFLKSRFLYLLIILNSYTLNAQVVLRDTAVNWQHHHFELNSDYSIQSHSTSDTEIDQVTFTNGKVIENNLIKLVVLPEYGARVLSFVYKPTGHEYLYLSECGSAYGIGEGNFYYNWLMVYGGIFPTFPESEHGKTWLMPWKYTVMIETEQAVTIRMELRDTTSYLGAPGRFNNGQTGITCRIDITVYEKHANWEFDVTLINDQGGAVNYEYWTCTTLAPGSEVGKTGTPLTSTIVAPVDHYTAGWSPGGWIGGNGNRYDFSTIDVLDEWSDMGIAYAESVKGNYWGVINQENNEGVFRISENMHTPGMKLWTWGRSNINNNMFDYSNGGADNYIELWAGTSKAFFEDATLQSAEVKTWKESYAPTIGLQDIDAITEHAAINVIWNEVGKTLAYELNSFVDQTIVLEVRMTEQDLALLAKEELTFSTNGYFGDIPLTDRALSFGDHPITVVVSDLQGQELLKHTETLHFSSPLIARSSDDLKIHTLAPDLIKLHTQHVGAFIHIVNVQGQKVYSAQVIDQDTEVRLPVKGMYIVLLQGDGFVEKRKVVTW